MTDSTNRPQGYQGQGDSRLPGLERRLQRLLADTQRRFAYDSLRLGRDAVQQLAGVLVDFAEDLHNDIGIWRAYERYNVEFFGTSLPLSSGGSEAGLESAWSAGRFRHLLWVLYPAFIDGLILSPLHRDLVHLAEVTSGFLADAFQGVQQDSGVKASLQAPNKCGSQVKRKLVWLGCHSYMFRIFFANYLARHSNGASRGGSTDDFLCQQCTPWSGLGVIDILADVLDVPRQARDELRGWYEWHTAFYKILSVRDKTLEALNVMNDLPYRIRVDKAPNLLVPGQLLYGSLVPWQGDWYWSGERKVWGNASAINVEDLRRTMQRQHSRVVCRYCPDYEARVRQQASQLHQATLAYYGTDLLIYRDGVSMAADWQREFRQQWASRSPEEVRKVIRRHGLTKSRPDMRIAPDLLEHNDGIGVFLNPEEGKEIMTHFTPLVAGLKRRGADLTEDEEQAVQGFFRAAGVSPQFVRRVLAEYGDESVRAVFLLKGELPGYWQDYLLRSHKGQFYRKRYPHLAVG